MGTTTTKKNDDDAMRIHNEELKANVAKMDAFLDAMEKAIVNANDEDEDTDDKKCITSSSSASSKMVSLQKAEKLLERTRLGLLAFAVLLKTNGVNSDEHEGLQRERKRVEAYSRKIEETKKRITKKNEEEEEEEEEEEIGEIKEESRKNNTRHREDGEIPRANGRVASRFVFNALGGSKKAEKNRLKQEAQAKLRRSIEEDVKSKFEERVNERYREKDKSRGTGEKQKTKKKKTNDHAEPEIEDGEYSD